MLEAVTGSIASVSGTVSLYRKSQFADAKALIAPLPTDPRAEEIALYEACAANVGDPDARASLPITQWKLPTSLMSEILSVDLNTPIS